MNKVQLLGRICHDLELKTSGENKYTRFNVAINRRYTKEDGTRDADFIGCVAWNNSAETIVKYFKKGNQIGIVGRLQSGSYDDQDGKKRYTTDVIVEEFDFVEKKSEERPAPEYVGKTDAEIVRDVATGQDPFEAFGQRVEIDQNDLPF